VRDQYGNPVEDSTPVAWMLRDQSSHFSTGGNHLTSFTASGCTAVTVVAPELPGQQDVAITAGAATATVSIPVVFTTASLTGPTQLDIVGGESGTVTLSTNAANGTPVFWTISNGDLHTFQGSVSNGSASIPLSATGTWARVGPCVVTATVGGRIVSRQIAFYSSNPYFIELDRFAICGDVTQDGVETIVYPNALPLSFAPAVVSDRTADLRYYAQASVTIHGTPGGIYFLDFADSTSSLIAEIVGADSYGRVQLAANGTATVQLRSKGAFDGNPYTPDFTDVPVRVRPADPNNPFAAQPPGANDRVVTARYVEHSWWTRTWDACQSFLGGDPETGVGVAANMAGGMLIVGDVGSLAKNGWRAAGCSDTPPNYTEVAFSGMGLLTELAVGAGELADAPISGVRSLLAALGNVPAGKVLPILYRRSLSNTADMGRFVRFIGKIGNETAFQVLKEVLTSEDVMLAAIKASDEFGDALFTGLKNVSRMASTGGIAGAQKAVKVLCDLPQNAKTFFKGLTSGQLELAIEHMGLIFAGGKVDEAMLRKLLTYDELFSTTYDRLRFLGDLRALSGAQRLDILVKYLANPVENFRLGRLYELQAAAAIAGEGGTITIVGKYVKNAQGITDVDFIINGVYYQAKRGWSGASVEETLAWIAKAKEDGAQTIKYVCPGGESSVPPKILEILSDGSKNPLRIPIPIVDVPIP
jgi:hypothetical protein